MDEKITTPVEEVAEPQQTLDETPAEQTALLEKLDAVQQALATLQQSFDDKIAEDAHKNGLFDNMHRELVRYQNGVLDKIVDTIALDIIQLVDSTKGHVRVYEKKEPTEENYKKLLRIVKGIAEDLEDILYRQNIESYRVPGHEVDTRRQKIIQTVPTDDKSKDNGQPISKVLQALLKNITKINGCEKQMIEILFATSDNQALFENILSVFMAALREPRQLEQLCVKYVEITESLTDRQLNRFEQLLLETPGAAPIATRLCARKIASSKNPEDEFWRFYDNQRSRISANSGFTIEPMILACINNVDAKIREDVAIDILRKINASVINDGETIMVLTNAVNDCSVKELSKMDSAFLQRVCQIRAKVDKSGLEKIKAVFIGEMLTANNAQRKRPVNLSGELAQTGISLKSVEKSDYEAYIKNYFDEYFVLLQASEDVPALMRIFYHGRYFSNFIDDYISVLKKKAKKETERWKRILAWTCVYLVTAERSDQAAEELYKPIVRYLRSLDEDRLLDVRQAVIQDVPSSRCDYLFDEVRRKEGFVEKLGGFFHKK